MLARVATIAALRPIAERAGRLRPAALALRLSAVGNLALRLARLARLLLDWLAAAWRLRCKCRRWHVVVEAWYGLARDPLANRPLDRPYHHIVLRRDHGKRIA